MKQFTIAAMALLAATFALPAQAEEEEAEFIKNIQGYLDVSEKYVSLANGKDHAVFFAVEGIVEIHQERGEQAKAIPALKKILEKYPDNRTVRNIIRFKLRDVYVETGRADLALAELEAVIEENR
tara:strand:+ start:335 stop:709 length:375 start_codon:yes stop_codon:yes gene_type:complete